MIHLVGRINEVVFGFLGPLTTALAKSGVRQVVVLIDDPQQRGFIPRFHESVELVLSPMSPGIAGHWPQLLSAFRATVDRQDLLQAVHVHGIRAWLVWACIARSQPLRKAALFCSPHGSRALGWVARLGSPLHWLARALLTGSKEHVIASASGEMAALHSLTGHTSALIESPVDGAFFSAQRRESRSPLVVTSSHPGDVRSAELFVQMAVLLGGEDLHLAFNWIGNVDAVTQQRLTSAGVGVFEVVSPAERALRLSAGWLYFAPAGSHGFPIHLAEAMAAGLTCIAMDTPEHRDLIRHGDTGFICNDAEAALRCVAALLDDVDMRRDVGLAAQREATHRFDERRFESSVLHVYGVGNGTAEDDRNDNESAPIEGLGAAVRRHGPSARAGGLGVKRQDVVS